MLLSADELEILEYLRSWKGATVSIIEICRCAGGRKKFKESPHWAKTLMARLVEAKFIEVNERGHYRAIIETKPAVETRPAPVIEGQAVGDDYFPVKEQPQIIGGDYFPQEAEAESEDETKIWMSPQIEEILQRAAKNLGGPVTE